MYSCAVYTAPTAEPCSLAEVKRHVRVPTDDPQHDAVLSALLTAARQYVENHTGRQLCSATYDAKRDSLPADNSAIYLPRPPLSSVTSLKYLDSNGTEQTWAASNYRVSTGTDPGRISLAYATCWPTVRAVSDGVTIRFVAGYGGAASVPQALKAAILLLVGNWFENREAVVIGTIQSQLEFAISALLEQYRVPDEFLAYERAYVPT